MNTRALQLRGVSQIIQYWEGFGCKRTLSIEEKMYYTISRRLSYSEGFLVADNANVELC